MHLFQKAVIASALLLPLTLTQLQASATSTSTQTAPTDDAKKPISRADKLKQLQRLSTMGTAKDLGSFGEDFQGDCPTLVSNQMLTTLLSTPVTKKERGGFGFDYFEKQNIHYGGKTFSANIKNDSSSIFLMQLKTLKTHTFGALSKREEIRDQDTNAVRKGASLCRYQVFQASDETAYIKLMQHLAEGLKSKSYADFSALQKDIVKQGGEAVGLEGTLNVAVSQPGG
ncbi:MAG: hypothetical protein C0514_08985 [Candidatus Puniceispirillum sp.]|nr:hypothetical protein [Candidatus Puniceispirillum sp.]